MDPTSLDMGGFALYSVMGICVVFVALVLIMAMIKILVAVTSGKKATAEEGTVAASTAAKAEPVLAPGTAGELNLYDTDPRDAAMIMAIVADDLKKPLNELRFISIREVKVH